MEKIADQLEVRIAQVDYYKLVWELGELYKTHFDAFNHARLNSGGVGASGFGSSKASGNSTGVPTPECTRARGHVTLAGGGVGGGRICNFQARTLSGEPNQQPLETALLLLICADVLTC